MKPKAVIVDVDGTLVDVSGVRHYVMRPRGKKNFRAFHAAAELCPPIPFTLGLIAQLDSSVAVLVVTARKQQWETSTRRWLRKWEVKHDTLFMRGDADNRPDVQVKADILERIRRTHDVVLAVDDNPAVLALWQAEGIPTVTIPGWEVS